ncbi:hypothetical protein [Qipengyuania flava]|uniref:hypothetical protein n=1 Tax=Qipengyuania flava TaxID=192812 RepID=UPI001CD61E36|nr:hypothetical protein [Qipengyuania flava]MCA0890492.1 hypothetical protein [Qipengyuania flava]
MSFVTQVIDAFELLYSGLRDSSFRKSLPLDQWSEKQPMPLVRTFLLGYFRPKARPEFGTVLPGALSGHGRVDFIVYGVAVEFAVRRPWCPRSDLMPRVNRTEVLKLMKHRGRALLVLFDLARDGLEDHHLAGYRALPSMGRRNHSRSPFSVAYFGLRGEPVRLNVRV